MAEATIRIRYKNGDTVGDPAAFNNYNSVGGFPKLKYPGDEEEIPATELDDTEPFLMYTHPNKNKEQVTEKQYRQLMFKYGGYDKNSHYHEAAPPARPKNVSMILPPRKMDQAEFAAFLAKQQAATLKYKHFNPISMELISEMDEKVDEKNVKNNKKDSKTPDISKMKVKEAVDYIKDIQDENVLASLSVEEDRNQQRPAIIHELEQQMKRLRGV